jgi:mannose-6-phosphate isomerase-like protein (cupin superfamily)
METTSEHPGIEIKHISYKAGIDVFFLSESPVENKFKCIVQAKSRTPMTHYHENFDEIVQCTKGVVTVMIDGKAHQLKPAETVMIPKGAVHQIANNTNETIEFLCEIRPGIFGYDYFRNIEPIVNAPGLPDIEHLKMIMRTHGLVPVIGLKQSIIFAVIRLLRLFKK